MDRFSLRLKLDDLLKMDNEERIKILENIRYCRRMVGKGFSVIFWNKNLNESDIKKFVSESNSLLFEINSNITKKFTTSWFLINEDETDESSSRYVWKGAILSGIVKYMEMIKIIKIKERE